jgi:2-methylcitrate dehydratase PrpD
MPAVLETLAEFAADLRDAPVPAAAVHAAKRCVVDWFACAIPGGGLPPATLVADALGRGGEAEAMLIPSGRLVGARTAALVNGAAAHVIEFDDIFRDAVYHPGAPVVAAALAAAQARGKGGGALLRAVIAGYEVSTRIGAAVSPAHYEFWHTTGTVGCFGAAAAAAVALGLDGRRAADALGNAGTFAAGLQEAFRGSDMSKPLHAGRAAETGLLVALLAERGVGGPPGILEGRRGFGAAMARDPDWRAAVDGLGIRWNIRATTQKNHAACGHTFAAVDGAIALTRAHGLAPERVRRVRVGTYAKAQEVSGIADPRTPYEARFSLAYCVAAALVWGRLRLEAFQPARLADPAVRELMRRVEVRVDPAAEAAFPKRRSATVEIETTEGEVHEHRASTRKGDPENPLTDDEIADKYRELVEPELGREAAQSLLGLLWRLEEIDDLGSLPFGARAAPRKAAAGR